MKPGTVQFTLVATPPNYLRDNSELSSLPSGHQIQRSLNRTLLPSYQQNRLSFIVRVWVGGGFLRVFPVNPLHPGLGWWWWFAPGRL